MRVSGSTRAALEMLSHIEVKVLESIVVNELCEYNGRQNLADTGVTITSLVRTTSDDSIPNEIPL